MRDLTFGSLPLFRLFRVQVKVHWLVPVLPLLFILRVSGPDYPSGLWLEVLILSGMGFLAVLLHEYGHCFAARSVEGDANEIIMWPLGGLATVDVPQTPRANFMATAGGPAVNLGLAFITGFTLMVTPGANYLPPLNPFDNPLQPMRCLRDGQVHGNKYVHAYSYREGERTRFVRSDATHLRDDLQTRVLVKDRERTSIVVSRCEDMPDWVMRMGAFFWTNWLLFLINLVPTYPLDGGRMLHALLWAKIGHRQATSAAITSGKFSAVGFFCLGILFDSSLPLILAMVMYVASMQTQILLESGAEESQLGYDFSMGYTSLERDQPPTPRPAPELHSTLAATPSRSPLATRTRTPQQRGSPHG